MAIWSYLGDKSVYILNSGFIEKLVLKKDGFIRFWYYVQGTKENIKRKILQ